MKRHLLIIVPLAALLLFTAVQVFMIESIWKQKEEILLMKYEGLSREGYSMLLLKKKANGFEKAMDVIDQISGMLIKEELPNLESSKDTLALKEEMTKYLYSVIYKNEKLTSFLKSYMKDSHYDTEFKTILFVSKFYLFVDGEKLALIDEEYPPHKKNLIPVSSIKEEHNNFVIEFAYLIDLTRKNEMVFHEAFLSLVLIIASILIVFLVFWLTWRNLLEERRLSELKTDFINNMTHELKTPLSTITVAGRTLEKEQILRQPAMILDTARLIGKQSIHLNKLINTILEVSLLERTEFELNKQSVNIDELTHEIVSSFLTACDNCAKVNEDFRTDGVAVNIDILYYTTVINNLLTNAVKYCTAEPAIDLSIYRESGNVIITISDNGVGIAREHLDHIFEKFYRVPHGNIHKTKGLGLGLYYVYRIVKAHAGDVSVTSRPGRGTTFRIKLPI